MDEKEVDGVYYHVDCEGDLVRNENGFPIESYVCLCYALSQRDCVCGAWDREVPGEPDE